jgi:DNA-binding beta-propeller fold protein YncE
VHARLSTLITLALIFCAASVSAARAQTDYTLFEAGQVRPMAMSPDGSFLYVCNTPDGYLERYVLGGSVIKATSIPVGLEPVAVAAPNDNEVWVVNHLSDSVSIVDVSVAPARVVRTLLVGDEPRDIVFAGGKAFITTAHRGQNTPWPDGDYATPGVGRADVWVFNVADPGPGMGGTPITVINLFGDRPRALAASPDGTRVYAAVFRSGNQTAAVSEGLVCNGPNPCTVLGTTYPGGRPNPETNIQSVVSRETGIVVGFDPQTGQWRDELARNWNPALPFSVPDLDVFEIDAIPAVPTELGVVSGVGTILFNMIVNPVNGDVYVTNTDANNRVRFEGVGNYVNVIGAKPSGDPASVRGNLAKARITVLDASGDNPVTPETEFNVIPRHLNPHIPYGVNPVPAGVKDKSIATPTEMVISADGSKLYVAGLGSNGVHVYDTAQLKNGTFVPNTADIFPVAGPSGLVLDEAQNRLYVTSRISSRLYVLDATSGATVQVLSLFSPEPPEVIDGRPFLYDAKLTGSNGEASCSSCHIFGDTDDLSWDLGDPDAIPVANTNPKPLQDPINAPNIGALPAPQAFDALKGPMTTQSLRGLVNSGPMHWRGDRRGPACATIDLNRNPACENQAFNAFNVAFPGLVGRDEGELDPADMQAFTDFALQITYPPNPIRNLDNSLTTQQQAGSDLYHGRISDVVANCSGCHVLDRAAGFFGTSGGTTFENETMEFKVPHLRNAYQKVGMFGMMPSSFFPDATGVNTGAQVRGTGFLHDGSVASVFDFLGAAVFDTVQPPIQPVPLSDSEQRDLEAFVMAFDSDLAPIVGQQVTLTDTSGQDVLDRINLLVARANALFPETGQPECDLIVKGVVGTTRFGWVYRRTLNDFLSDINTTATLSELLSIASVPGRPMTFTCVPPGSGSRMGIDRDGDTLADGVDPIPDAFTALTCSVGRSTPSGTAFNLWLLMILGLCGRSVASGRRRRG